MRRTVNGVRMWMGAVVAAAAIGWPLADVSADTASGHVGMSWGTAAMVGGLDSEFADNHFNMELEGGFRVSRFELGGTFLMSMHDSVEGSRHPRDLMRLEFGPHASVYLTENTGWRPYATVSLRRVWFTGGNVRRQCADHSVCDAGFFTDTDGYKGHSVSAGLGVEYLIDSAARQKYLVAGFAQVEYQHIGFEIIDRPVSGGVVTLSLGFRYGGGKVSR